MAHKRDDRSKLGQTWPIFGQPWPTTLESGPNLVKIGLRGAPPSRRSPGVCGRSVGLATDAFLVGSAPSPERDALVLAAHDSPLGVHVLQVRRARPGDRLSVV